MACCLRAIRCSPARLDGPTCRGATSERCWQAFANGCCRCRLRPSSFLDTDPIPLSARKPFPIRSCSDFIILWINSSDTAEEELTLIFVCHLRSYSHGLPRIDA